MNQPIASSQDIVIVCLSLFLFPVFVGTLNFILTMLTTKGDLEKSTKEARNITVVMWAVLFIGVLAATAF